MKKVLLVLSLLGAVGIVLTGVFRKERMDGSLQILSLIAGDSRKSIVVFFHPECDICHRLVRKLDSMQLDGYTVIFVAPVSEAVADSALLEYWKFHGCYQFVCDSVQRLADKLQIDYIPTTYVVHGNYYRKYLGDGCEFWELMKIEQ
ncbi:MAG: hypothetical protein J5808_01655 [Paludibacteraceae bacterium]|nr:hypothetical protein [Paludibacteraceae bacterium]